MKVKIKTKSNYRDLNGQWLDVVEAVGKRITCSVPSEFQLGAVNADFDLSEVEEIDYSNSVPYKTAMAIYNMKKFMAENPKQNTVTQKTSKDE